MREINKLVHLVTHELKSSFGALDLSGQSDKPGKEQQLYNGVLDGKYFDDEVTAKGMYNANIYDQRFRMLKSRLRYKLYDLLYYVDFDLPKYTFVTKQKLECIEYLHKAHILFELGEYDMAEKQFNKVLVAGAECQFTNELITANELKRKVLALSHRPTDFELTIDELERLRRIRTEEEKAEDLFLKVELLLTKSIHSRNTNHNTVKDAIKELEALYGVTQSYNIFEKIYQLKIWDFNLNNEFDQLEEYLKSIPKVVEGMSIEAGCFDRTFNELLLARTYLLQEKFDQGLSRIEEGYEWLDRSTTEWFAHGEMHFLLAIRSANYDMANHVLNSVVKNPNFTRISDQVANRWKLFKLYLNFARPDLGIQKRIRFYDVYESSDAYFVEQKAYKVSLYILEFLHQLNKGNMESAESKLDDLESFFYKHLNEPGKNQREKQFLKMIKSLRSNGFDVASTEEKIVTYKQRMSEKKVVNAFADIEIIAYEELWKIITKAVSQDLQLMSQ